MRIFNRLLPVLLLLVVGGKQTRAQLIPTNTVIDWTHVGVRMAIPARTNLIDVSQSPYNADKTGATDATAAIQLAINAAANNQVVYFPDGNYLITGSLTVRSSKSGITLRGNTNSVLVGVGNGAAMLNIGNNGDINGSVTDTILSGSTRGSSQITLSAAPSFAVGDELTISESDVLLGSAAFPIINVHQWDHNIRQQVIATAISGNTVTLSDPLIWDFTNAPVVMAAVGGVLNQVGLENLILTTTNAITGGIGSYGFTIWMADCSDCWVTNCSILYSHAYAFYTYCCSHLTIAHNTVRFSQGSGNNHSGFICEYTGGALFADNIIADGLQPGFEFNSGFCGNAVFGNFFTNNIIDVDNHGPHSMMNLWEGNVLSGYFEMDGYFGSSSHQTLLRNMVGSTYIPLQFKRWTTYMNVVGNVLGAATGNYSQYTSEANNPSGAMIIQLGYPNIGNSTFASASAPLPWNYPLTSYPSADSSGQLYPTPICSITSDQGPTTNLLGNFTSITASIASQGGSSYSLVFQDNVNTNLYYPTNGAIVFAAAAGTGSNVTLNTAVKVKSGWKVFLVGQNAWQQLQSSNKLSDTISGNYDYYHQAVTWGTTGVQAIPTSLLYPNGAPEWWGTNRWPAIDPVNAVLTAAIPAQYRYTPGANAIPAAPAVTNLTVAAPIPVVTNTPLIASSRVVDWSAAGIPGGIPVRTNIFVNVLTTLNPAFKCIGDGVADDSAQIANAIMACPADQVVYLPAASYNLANRFYSASKSRFTLRGDGPGKTILIDNSQNGSLFMLGSGVGKGNYFDDYLSPSTTFSLNNGYTKGSSNLVTTLANQGGVTLAVGNLIQISESNDWFVTSSGQAGAQTFSSITGDGQHCLNQMAVITSINNGTNLTIWPPLAWTYSKSLSPVIYLQDFANYYVPNVPRQDGFENLTVTNALGAVTGSDVFDFYCPFQCWLSNVEIVNANNRTGVFFDALQCQIDHCWFHASSTNYIYLNSQNWLTEFSTACLIQNNIFDGYFGGLQISSGGCANVVAYNLFTNYFNPTPGADPGRLAPGLSISGGAYPMMNLVEGNIGMGVQSDFSWGSAGYDTVLRNAFTSVDRQWTVSSLHNLMAVQIDAANNWDNIVGNILGSPNISYAACQMQGQLTGSSAVIYRLGYPVRNNNSYSGTNSGPQSFDTNVLATALLVGNYDYSNGAVVNPTNTVPKSLYLGAKPLWFGSLNWPPYDSASPTSASVTNIPAGYRYVYGVDPTGINSPFVFTATVLQPPNNLSAKGHN